jgi:hypothetical protein
MRPGDPRGPPLAAGGVASTPLYSGLTHRSEPLPRHRIALPFLLIFEATIMAIIYEGGSLPGLTISSRLRLALTLWMGFSVLVLTAGIVFAGSSSSGLITTIAIFVVLAVAGVLTIAILHRRQLRDAAKVGGSQPSDGIAPV